MKDGAYAREFDGLSNHYANAANSRTFPTPDGYPLKVEECPEGAVWWVGGDNFEQPPLDNASWLAKYEEYPPTPFRKRSATICNKFDPLLLLKTGNGRFKVYIALGHGVDFLGRPFDESSYVSSRDNVYSSSHCQWFTAEDPKDVSCGVRLRGFSRPVVELIVESLTEQVRGSADGGKMVLRNPDVHLTVSCTVRHVNSEQNPGGASPVEDSPVNLADRMHEFAVHEACLSHDGMMSAPSSLERFTKMGGPLNTVGALLAVLDMNFGRYKMGGRLYKQHRGSPLFRDGPITVSWLVDMLDSYQKGKPFKCLAVLEGSGRLMVRLGRTLFSMSIHASLKMDYQNFLLAVTALSISTTNVT